MLHRKDTLALPQLNYNRGDYNLLRRLFQRVDWTVLQGSDMRHAYHFFVSTLREAVTAAVPVSQPKSNKNLYMNSQARKFKREKYSLWSTYTNAKDAVDSARYCRCRNRLRKLTRELRRNLEHKLSKELKQHPKAFWKYSKSRLKTNNGIDALKDEGGQMVKDDTDVL